MLQEMPRKCCVPECSSNYRGTDYVTVFRFPTDEKQRTKWIRTIPRKDFTPTKDAVVCIKHFSTEFIVTEDCATRPDGSVLRVKRTNPKLAEEAYPSIFPILPSYLSSEPPKKRRTPEDRHAELDVRDQQAFMDWEQNDTIDSFNTLRSGINAHIGHDPDLVVVSSDTHVCICILDITECPKIKVAVKIVNNLKVSVFCDYVRISGDRLSWILGSDELLDRWSKLDSLLSHFMKGDIECRSESRMEHALSVLDELCDEVDSTQSDKSSFSLNFLTEQLHIRLMSRKTYSAKMMLWACRLFLFSPKAYDFLRKTVLMLPHESYLRRLTSCLSSSHAGSVTDVHIAYLRNKARYLEPHQKVVSLMLDEIHVEPTATFKGGNIQGFASNNSQQQATTVQAFMIASVLSKDRDVVSLVPVVNMTAAYLKEITLKVMRGIHDAGYRVLCIISDNNRINRNMFTLLCGGNELKPFIDNPFDSTIKLFFLFDSVHLLKCIRNNWINQADTSQTFTFPDLDNKTLIRRACFADLKKLHSFEDTRIVKLAPNLTHKALNPSSTERQKVSLVLKVFNEKTIAALSFFPALSDSVDGTKSFLDIILKLWKLFNVKDPHKGRHLRDRDSDPFRSVNDERLKFMEGIVLWLNNWEAMKCKGRHGCLSQETHFALLHTVKSMQLLIHYLLGELKINYVLPGKFQTDNLEYRFSQYRQLSGGNYHVSVRQIIESEKKLKLLSVLHLKSAKCGDFNLIKFLSDVDEQESYTADAVIPDAFADVVSDSCDGCIDDRDLTCIVFIAGYIAHKVCKLFTCKLCQYELCTDRELLCEFGENLDDKFLYIEILNRGGLKWPTQFLTDIVSDVFVVFNCLISKKYETEFLSVTNQRDLVVRVSLDFINHLDNTCECGITTSKLVYRSVFIAANIMLNNYTKLVNDKKKPEKSDKSKRKLATLAGK